MNKILNIGQATNTATKLRNQGRTIGLVGGCFDVLHNGHIHFLNNAKKKVDILFILLESDQNVHKRKGEGRPVNSQKDRALVLSSISSIDYIIPLKLMTKDSKYDRLVIQIKPDVIAQTEGDTNSAQRLKQCKLVDAELIFINKIDDISTTNLLKK